MKRQISLLLAAALAAVLLAGCGTERAESGAEAPAAAGADEPVIWHVSDIHYIAPELIEDRDYFARLMEDADGKLTHYIEEITDAFISQALEARPDAVIISGDLTLNGAKQSHLRMAEKLSALSEAGIRVLVIPGNHDMGKTAARFTADGVEGTEGTTPEEFREIYLDCGYGGALSEDEESLSYTAELGEDLTVLMLDVNAALRGSVPSGTLKWAEEQLEKARAEGRRVIAVSHQNVLVHCRLFTFGYQINNADRLNALYAKYAVALNLSGHLHIQHVMSDGGLTEIDTSSLAVTPHQYGVLTLGDRASYRTETVAVTVEGIEDFAAYSAEFFDRSNSKFDRTEPEGFTPEDWARMTAWAKEMNRGFFAGRVPEADEELMELWRSVPGFHASYLEAMLPGAGQDYTRAELDLSPAG